jgi:putative drug exporter of the RND superfamily
MRVSMVLASQVESVLGPGEFTIAGSQSSRAATLLQNRFHQNGRTDTVIIVRADSGSIASSSFKARVRSVVGRVRADTGLHATFVDNPLVSGNQQLIARNRRSIALLISSSIAEQSLESQINHLRSLVKLPGVTTYVTGGPAEGHDYAVQSQTDIANERNVILPLLVIVLLLVFGTVVAAGLPLMLALFSIPVSLSGVYIFAHFINTSIYATNVVEVLGLGISIDYSLFIVYRFREELRRHDGDREAAIVRTMATTGRAVFFSGITVAIGLAALLLSGVVFMQSLGLAGILVPISALLTAMTLLPAVLSALGTKVNRLRVLPKRMLETGDRGPWHRLATTIMRRPVVAGGLVLVVLLLAALPATHLAYSYGGLKNAPTGLQSIQGYLYMQSHYPTTPDPTMVIVESPARRSLLSAPELSALRGLQVQLGRLPGVNHVVGPATYLRTDAAPSPAQLAPLTGRYIANHGDTALIELVGSAAVGTSASATLVRRARTLAGRFSRTLLRGNTILVGGSEAGYYDWDNVVLGRFPYVVGLILLLTYGFLFFAFRSVFLPLKAVLLNLLSVLTAYGLMVLVFQGGIGSSVLSFTPEDGIATWVPVFLFAFLFGLSMDYEVLLLSRVRESWLATGSNRESVALGLEKTGRLITSAALIMVIAFGSFLLGSQIQFKEFGFGLLISVAVDASLIRVVVVPAIMELMGNWNWWVPGSRARWSRSGSGSFEPVEEAVPQTVTA